MSLKWGIVGAGGVAKRRAMPAMVASKRAEIAAVMVRDQARADALAEEIGAPKGYSVWKPLLEDSEVEAVYIASPVNAHCDQVVMAAEAGKHVLCDKPMAMNLPECDRMIEASIKAGVYLQICFLQRFMPANQQVRRWVRGGDLGVVLEARAAIMKDLPQVNGTWRVDPAVGGGGSMMDLGAHSADLLAYITGPIGRVSAMVSNRASSWEVEDTATCLMEGANGAHLLVSNSFKAVGGDMVLEVNGTGGYARIAGAGSRPSGFLMTVNRGEGVEEHDLEATELYGAQIDHFAACVEDGETPIVSGEDGRHNIAVIEAAYLSARTGAMQAVAA